MKGDLRYLMLAVNIIALAIFAPTMTVLWQKVNVMDMP
jgi:hypothetical protein